MDKIWQFVLNKPRIEIAYIDLYRLSCVQNCICPDYRAFIFFPDRVILNARRYLEISTFGLAPQPGQKVWPRPCVFKVWEGIAPPPPILTASTGVDLNLNRTLHPLRRDILLGDNSFWAWFCKCPNSATHLPHKLWTHYIVTCKCSISSQADQSIQNPQPFEKRWADNPICECSWLQELQWCSIG